MAGRKIRYGGHNNFLFPIKRYNKKTDGGQTSKTRQHIHFRSGGRWLQRVSRSRKQFPLKHILPPQNPWQLFIGTSTNHIKFWGEAPWITKMANGGNIGILLDHVKVFPKSLQWNFSGTIYSLLFLCSDATPVPQHLRRTTIFPKSTNVPNCNQGANQRAHHPDFEFWECRSRTWIESCQRPSTHLVGILRQPRHIQRTRRFLENKKLQKW